jgi:hypothetical protein
VSALIRPSGTISRKREKERPGAGEGKAETREKEKLWSGEGSARGYGGLDALLEVFGVKFLSLNGE